jgi:L-ascorbate metabolism protein UlaG (beta-lactamase superfamily)
MLEDVLNRISWLGHDSFRVGGTPTIYVDPWKLKSHQPAADIILVTHEHFDHFSKEDVDKLRKPDTVVVTTPAVAAQLSGAVHAVQPGDKLTVKGVAIEVVPAYNVNKFRAPGQPFHPKEDAKVGFVFTVDGARIYHTGDSDLIPEMASVQADIALIPVSGTYVMTADEAVEAARLIKPKVAIPMHYGDIVGSLADAEQFKREAPVDVRILQPE